MVTWYLLLGKRCVFAILFRRWIWISKGWKCAPQGVFLEGVSWRKSCRWLEGRRAEATTFFDDVYCTGLLDRLAR